MRTRIITGTVIVIGLGFGYAIGFGTSVVMSTMDMPFISSPYSSHDHFTNVFLGVGRLATSEDIAGFCNGPNAHTSPDRNFQNEEYTIRAIQDEAPASGLNPPLDVARARLAVRRAMLAEKNKNEQLKAQYEAAAGDLLQKSGWKDASPARMREIVTRIDTIGSTCSPSSAPEGQQK